MGKLGDRLRKAREELGMEQADVAAEASRLAKKNIGQQRISDIESGGKINFRDWQHVADALRIDRDEWRRLAQADFAATGGKRLLRSLSPGSPPPNAGILGPAPEIGRRRIPVFGQAVGGALGEYIFNGEAIDWVICPPGLENVTDAYAVFVDGDSMSPRYRAGETVWVHPRKPPRRGDDVVVQIMPSHEGDAPHGYIKEFVGWAGSKLKLAQHNPRQEISFDRDRVVSVHTIVFSQKI